MKITALMENTCGSREVCFEHGLSIYVETKKHKILVDTGASDRTWDNAKALGIDTGEIDTAFLSHGHYDHSGGLMTFAGQNKKAKIYIPEKAGGDYYSIKADGPKYIGIDKRITELPKCRFMGPDLNYIDDEISVFGGVTGRKSWPQSNLDLRIKIGDDFVQDRFDHEQYAVIKENGRSLLISGCAHNGILNILDRYEELFKDDPDMVISGFHMMKKDDYNEDEIKTIKDTALTLKTKKTKFFTGHCTGLPAFMIMKEIMGDQLEYIHSGDSAEL